MAKRGRKAARKAPARKATVKLIKKVLAAEIETKFVSQTTGSQNQNSNINNGDLIPAIPPLLQDQGDSAAWRRIGTKVTPKSLKLHCHVGFGPEIVRSSAINVHYFVLTQKRYKNMTGVLANGNMSRLLRTGDQNMYFPFDGNNDVAMLPVNTAEFNVIKRGSFKLSKNTGDLQDSLDTGNQPLGGPVSRDWVITIPTPAKLTYEQDNALPRTQDYPTNFAPFIVFGYTHQDASTPDLLNQDIFVQVRPMLWYDDA